MVAVFRRIKNCLFFSVFFLGSENCNAELLHCLPTALTKSERKYPVIPMAEGYLEADRRSRVPYFRSADARASYRLEIENGLFVTLSKNGEMVPMSARRLFAMGNDGAFFGVTTNPFYNYNHSSLFAGEPVVTAGEILVSNGSLQYISTSSGHYKPSDESILFALESLFRQGVDLSHATVAFGGSKMQPAQRGGGNALKHLFRQSLARECLDRHMRNFEQVTADDLRVYEKIDKDAFAIFISNIESGDELPRYYKALLAAISNDSSLLKYFQDATIERNFPDIKALRCARILKKPSFLQGFIRWIVGLP